MPDTYLRVDKLGADGLLHLGNDDGRQLGHVADLVRFAWGTVNGESRVKKGPCILPIYCLASGLRLGP